MMFSTPAGPQLSPWPPLDGRELHVHPQRVDAIDASERRLVTLWLSRYIVWNARRRQFNRMRDALGLLTELGGLSMDAPDPSRYPPR